MLTTLEQIIKDRNPKTTEEAKAIIRELIQKVVLVGLSRANFFLKASFYGGTALRIFYDLNRYSEDLDFTLNNEDESFSLEPYISKIKEVALSYNLDLEITTKTKQIESPIESAFAKLNTYQTLINLKLDERLINVLHKDETIKVKLEIDCHPALGFKVVNKWIDIPDFAPIGVLDEESLFAGKIHAILCRNYKNTVKGRDYYDYLFYISRNIKPNINYLKNKLIDSGVININDEFNIVVLKKMLKEKFKTINYNQVIDDASKFILNKEDLSYYCSELFIQMTDKLKED